MPRFDAVGLPTYVVLHPKTATQRRPARAELVLPSDLAHAPPDENRILLQTHLEF